MIKTVLSLATSLSIVVGCSGDCQESTYNYRSKQCAMIVDKQNSSGRYLRIQGQNIKTLQKETFSGQGGWYPTIYKLIEVGDTVIKRQQEMIFYIHKRDTIIAVPYECQGKIY